MQDPGKLDKIIEEWLPHAEKGTPGDLALEAKIAEWNARQDIVSHYPDTGVIVPAWDGTTHETAIAWSARRVEAPQSRVAEAALGIAWCRDRVCRSGDIPVVAVALKI